MSLLTELKNIFDFRFYKYVAPMALDFQKFIFHLQLRVHCFCNFNGDNVFN